MPAKKEDPMAATHFAAHHQVGGFKQGQVFTAAELKRSFGRDKDATPEEHEEHQATQLRRLLDLGAISPAEAPEEEERDDAGASGRTTERAIAEEEAAARKAKAEAAHPAPTQQPKK